MSADMLAAFNGVLSQPFPEKLNKNATVAPVGLDFGPTWISASFSIDADDIPSGPYSTGVPCGQVYKDFYEEALSKKVQSHLEFEEQPPSAEPLVPTEERASELEHAFAQHIKDAKKMGVWALDKNPSLDFRVMAIAVPDHWDDSARTVVAKAARLAGQPLDSSYMMLKFPRAVQSGHEMCKDAPGRYLTLLIRYHKSHFHLMLVEMFGTDYVMKGQVCLRHLGEDEIKASSAALNKTSSGDRVSGGEPNSDRGISENPPHDDPLHDRPLAKGTEVYLVDGYLTPEPSVSTHPAHNNTAYPNDLYTRPPVNQYPPVDLNPVQEALEKFLLLMTPTDDSTPTGESSPNFKHAVSDVKYVVIDGEASSKGKKLLNTAIKEMFADTGAIRSAGSILDCGARGAELVARQHVQNPKHVGDWKDLPEYLAEGAA